MGVGRGQPSFLETWPAAWLNDGSVGGGYEKTAVTLHAWLRQVLWISYHGA